MGRYMDKSSVTIPRVELGQHGRREEYAQQLIGAL